MLAHIFHLAHALLLEAHVAHGQHLIDDFAGVEAHFPPGTAHPFGLPPRVVEAIFYNFSAGRVTKSLAGAWDIATPEQALADADSAMYADKKKRREAKAEAAATR